MGRITASAILLLASSSAAAAADIYKLPYEPEPTLRSSHDWSGGYVGGHIGYGRRTTSPSEGAVGGGGFLGGLLGGSLDISGAGGLLDGVLGDIGLDGLVADLLDALEAVPGDLLDDLLGLIGGGITEGGLALDLEGALDLALAGESLDFGLRGSDFETEMEGFLGGAQIGYNIQQGAVVFGLEADISATDMTDSVSFSGADSITVSSLDLEDLEIAEITIDAEIEGDIESEMNWLSTLRGRFGFAFDRVLVYGTGGLAMADLDLAATFTTTAAATIELLGGGIADIDIPASTISGAGGGLQIGYTLGAGIEYAINENWSAKLEYAYVNLGAVEIDFDDGSSMDMEVDMHIVKGGANYYF